MLFHLLIKKYGRLIMYFMSVNHCHVLVYSSLTINGHPLVTNYLEAQVRKVTLSKVSHFITNSVLLPYLSKYENIKRKPIYLSAGNITCNRFVHIAYNCVSIVKQDKYKSPETIRMKFYWDNFWNTRQVSIESIYNGVVNSESDITESVFNISWHSSSIKTPRTKSTKIS